MADFQKWAVGGRKDKSDNQLKLKCDNCGKIIDKFNRPEKKESNNGGCEKIICDKCGKLREKFKIELGYSE